MAFGVKGEGWDPTGLLVAEAATTFQGWGRLALSKGDVKVGMP
jgi:hypothetical protein